MATVTQKQRDWWLDRLTAQISKEAAKLESEANLTPFIEKEVAAMYKRLGIDKLVAKRDANLAKQAALDKELTGINNDITDKTKDVEILYGSYRAPYDKGADRTLSDIRQLAKTAARDQWKKEDPDGQRFAQLTELQNQVGDVIMSVGVNSGFMPAIMSLLSGAGLNTSHLLTEPKKNDR